MKERKKGGNIVAVFLGISIFLAILLLIFPEKNDEENNNKETTTEKSNYTNRYGVIVDDEEQKVVVAYVFEKSKAENYECDIITLDDDAMGWYYIDYHQQFAKEISEINPGNAIVIHYDDNFERISESWPKRYYRNIKKIEKIEN